VCIYSEHTLSARCQVNNWAEAWKGRDLWFDGMSCQACWFFIFYTRRPTRCEQQRAHLLGDCNAAAYQRGAAGQQRPSVRSPIVARIQSACGHEQSICSIYCSCLFTLAICLTECFDRISYSTSLVRPAKAVCPHRHVKWSKTNFVKYSLFSLNNIQRQSNIFRAAGEWVSDKVG